MKMALTALVVVLVSSHAAYGQMAKWAMRPGYDSIRLAAGRHYFIVEHRCQAACLYDRQRGAVQQRVCSSP